VLELDFAIDRHGLVEQTHADRYKEFGDWIRACYEGIPLAKATAAGGVTVAISSFAGQSNVFDRVMLEEDQRTGQHVRAWQVDWYGARLSAEVYTRVCHCFPRLLARSEHACDQWHSSRVFTPLTR
jgi:hypothetical protein